jgi:hypothetical protein
VGEETTAPFLALHFRSFYGEGLQGAASSFPASLGRKSNSVARSQLPKVRQARNNIKRKIFAFWIIIFIKKLPLRKVVK